MDQIDAMAHPLAGDAVRELLVETKFEIQSWIEGAIRLREEPSFPVGVFLSQLADFRAATPPRTVVIPGDLDFRDLAERPVIHKVLRGDLVGFAAVLRAYLHN